MHHRVRSLPYRVGALYKPLPLVPGLLQLRWGVEEIDVTVEHLHAAYRGIVTFSCAAKGVSQFCHALSPWGCSGQRLKKGRRCPVCDAAKMRESAAGTHHFSD